MHLHQTNHARSGNAILTAVLVMALAAALITSSTEMGVSTRRQVAIQTTESRVLAALDAVLARRQQQVIYMATNQRPEDFATWDKNYGVDYIGDIEVRWKIEPATSRRVDGGGGVTVVGNPMPGDTPAAGAEGGPPANAVENRGAFYLYRIAAEARYDSNVQHDAENSANDSISGQVGVEDQVSRAQGVRYVVTPNESALNYLLYYALRGPKADLEISHGWPMNLIGDIYTGGSAYLGSGTQVNDWSALRHARSALANFSQTDTAPWTIIGPPVPCNWPTWTAGTTYAVGSRVQLGSERYQCKAGHTATAASTPGSGTGWTPFWHDVTENKVIAIDGAYRLSKQVLYSAVNGFPMLGSVPSGYGSLSASYDVTQAVYPGEKAGNPDSASYRMPDPSAANGDIYAATWDGTVINPMRAKDPFATIVSSGADDMRQIMGVPLRGVDQVSPSGVGNDSRDKTRTSATDYVWKTGSMAAAAPGFNKMVRTQDNGTGPEELASRFRGRPEEPQRLEYPARDLDGDPTTDEHEYALPTFVLANGGTGTDFANRRTTSEIDAIEVPGTYLQKAMGAGRYMGRKKDYTGWRIVDANGADMTSVPSDVGLVIRERPVPDSSYFTANRPGVTDPYYMPYAYGKVRASVYPFLSTTVSGNSSDLLNGNVWGSDASNASTTVFRNIDTSTSTTERYEGAGSLVSVSAMAPGSGQNSWDDYNGNGFNDGTYQRFPHYHRDHWRFTHLRKPGRATVGSGLTAYYLDDRIGGQYRGPMGGRLIASRTDANVAFHGNNATLGFQAPSGTPSEYYSIRWIGWIKAPTSNTYTMTVNSDDGARLWIDNRLVVHAWNDQGAADRQGAFTFTQDIWYPVILDYYNKTGAASNCYLDWEASDQVRQRVPTGALAPATKSAFDWKGFTAVTAKITSFSGPTGAKGGLMLRPAAGVSPLLDGRDPYIALTWNPARGLVAQVRGERSRSATATGTGYFVGQATLNNPVGTSSALGEVAGYPTVVDPNPNAVTRTATLAIEPTAITVSRQAGQTNVVNVYTPGSSAPPAHPYAGVAGAPVTAWPANSGTNASWTLVKNGLTNVDQSIAQGMIKNIKVGGFTLRTQRWPQARSRIWMNTSWNYRLGGVIDPVNQLFRWNPGDAWNATTRPGWVGLPNDTNRYLVMFADPVGNRIFRTTGNNQGTWVLPTDAINTRNMYQLNNSLAIDNAGTDAGGRLSRGITGNTAGTNNYVWWFPDADANLISDVAQPDATATFGSARHFLYTTTHGGFGDTRPRKFNGTTDLGAATLDEVREALVNAYPGSTTGEWIAITDTAAPVPAYPNPAQPTYRTGLPPWNATPATPEEVPAVLRLTADPTAASTVLTISHVRMVTSGDILAVHSALGTELVSVTSVTVATNQITVVRGVRGTTALDHPTAALVSLLPFPASALAASLNATDVTSTNVPIWALPTATPFGIRVGDVLTISSQQGGTNAAIEQVRVTAIPPTTTAGTISFTRGVNGTTKRAWTLTAAQVFPATDDNLNDGNANASQTITPPGILLGGEVVARLNHASVTSTTNPITLTAVDRLALNDILLAGTELLTVSAIDSVNKKVTFVRGSRFSTAASIPNDLPLLRLTARTFAIDRSRTVTFDLNSYATAGSGPSPAWRSSATARAIDFGWFWSRIAEYRPFKATWTNITPVPRTGAFQPRVWGSAQTMPETAAPTADTPAAVDSVIPTGTLTAALGSRWADDQPTAHGSGSSSFNVGDTVYAGNALWRCKVAHTRDVANTPVTGGSAGTYWESANLWLRVEREAGTTWVRFLYAVASTESEASSRWRPILAEPGSAVAGRAVSGDARELRFDLARWFRATTVSTAMTSSTTAITLAAASGWKANVGDVLAIDNELVTVTSASADGLSLTISRATDGTTAATHAANSRITSAAYRGDDLLIGTCVNSGKTGSFSTFSAADFATLQVGNLKVENHNLASTDPDYDVDATDWEATTGDPTTAPTDDTKYLASQYQVFFGPYDITEDFFMYGQATSQRLAREDWIYNPREFWSQSRWWDDGTEKDPGYVLPTLSALTNREIWAKSTLLTLDMRQLQDYLRTRTLASAAESRLDGGYDSPIGAPATVLRTYLPDNGLIIHVSRTNRYPWNPEHKGKNPFNPALPNENTLTRTTASLAAEGDTDLRTSYFNAQVATMMATSRAGGWQLRSTLSTTDQSDVGQRLQPWTLATTASPGALMYAPPIKPQDFHHGVRLVNGRSIDWNHDATNGAASGGDDFGTSKLLIVTPNHIYIQGDFNSTPQPVNDGGVACSKSTPTAVYGDSVTFLSNAWSPGDLAWRIQGLAATHNAITAGGTLAYGQGPSLLPKASATTYACAVLTHNLPTTRSRVAMGEASALDDNLLVLEDWATISQTFIGSIVVMDTRRYTDAYRLDQLKTAGLTPFGFIGATTWNSVFTGLYARNEAYGNSFAITTGRVFTGLTGADGQRWAGQISQICGIPNRELFYNPDFKTKEGTPPEMPFGIKTVGVGGWMRVLR